MTDVSSEPPKVTAGLDLGDKYSYLCMIDQQSGEVIEEGRLRTTPEAFRRRFASESSLRIAIETGTHSPWANRVLEELGHEVLVANSRKLRLIYSNKQKTDEVDAENLARLARLDPKLLYPVAHRGEDSQAHMAFIRSRQALVGCRTQLVNPGYEGRSNPSGRACPSALPEASTKESPRAHPRSAFAGARTRLGADRLAHRAHPRLREAVGGDLQRALPGNRAPAPGRGNGTAHGAHLRAHPGGSPPLRKEPLRGRLSGAGARQGSVGRQRPSKAHLQGRRRDVKEASGRQRSLHPRPFRIGLRSKAPRREDSLPLGQKLKETGGGGGGEKALRATASPVGKRRGLRSSTTRIGARSRMRRRPLRKNRRSGRNQ